MMKRIRGFRQMMKRSILKVMSLVFLLTCLLVGVSVYMFEIDVKEEVGNFIYSKQVEEYRPVVEKYAKEHDVEEHVDLLLAMMMQESGGRGDDPMQSSESLCGEIGCIDNPEDSIKQGVAYFKEVLELAEGDRELAVQSYNFGIGFVGYVIDSVGEYSEEVAIEFSQMKYAAAEDKSIYTCLRKEAKQYDACYGDIYYVRDVMSFERKFAMK